jgi:ABC-2 type transport system ATP-binding protein
MNNAIEATGLIRNFGEIQAVRGIDLAVTEGEIFGFLGPNGAGKSTLVRMLTTLLVPTGGRAAVLGHDVVAEGPLVRRLIGAALQEAGLDGMQTGRELLTLQAQLYGLRGELRIRQVNELTELVGLTDAIDRRISTYSGGMRRRLDLASALLHRPRVLFLDEPTTGLDPTSRTFVWDEIRRLRADYGMTIFLTTQYLEEADQLADRVAIIADGRIVREGTPEALKAEVGADVIDVSINEAERAEAGRVIGQLQRGGELPAGELTPTGDGWTLFIPDGPASVAPLVRGLDQAGIHTGPISVSRPTLDDVFLAATGGRMAAAAAGADGQGAERSEQPTGARR